MDDVVKNPAGAPLGAAARSGNSLLQKVRANLRLTVLVILPAIVLIIGFAFYMTGGRYISTDNAYIGAHKILITPDVSGKVGEVMVREGQHVKAGDPLFRIESGPYQFALDQAQGKLASVSTDFANLKNNYKSLSTLTLLANQAEALKHKEVARKADLAKTGTGTQADLENAETSYLAAQLQVQAVQQQLTSVLNQLHGNPDLPIEE